MGGGVPALLGAFVWPTLFWGGAAAVGAPILIHLFARRRFKRIRWAAIEFLLQAERKHRRRVRLEELILLALRCLAVLLIALLVARPFFRPQGLAALVGGQERTERIFIIDDSFSMGYQTGEAGALADPALALGARINGLGSDARSTVFARAKRAVIELIELLRKQSPQDIVTVLVTSRIDRPIETGVYLDVRQTEELFARIEGLKVSQSGMSVRDVFQTVGGMIEEQSGMVNVAVYLVSDFQRKDWVRKGERDEAEGDRGGSPTEGRRDEGFDERSVATSRGLQPARPPETSSATPAAPLVSFADGDRNVSLILVDVGEEEPGNAAVTGLRADRSRFVAGVGEPVRATVANFSVRPTEPLNLEIVVGSSVEPTVSVDPVQGGESAEIPLTVAFPRPGSNVVRVATPEDALPVDDQRTLVVETVEAIRILVVNGEPSSDVQRDEVALLVTALRPPGDVFSGNDVERIDETELEEADLGRFDVVVLANVYRVRKPAADALSQFAAEGGGVAVFLGDQVDAESYNTVLFDEGRGLLPARIGERVAPATPVGLAAGDELHPVIRAFAGRDNPMVKQINFWQYFSCELSTERHEAEGDRGGSPKAARRHEGEERDEGDGAGAGDSGVSVGPGRVVAYFQDGRSTPAIIEQAFGDGRVMLFTSACDMEWNDWPKDASYVVAMLETAHHLARGRSPPERYVGTAIEFVIDPAVYDADVDVRTPGYPAEQEIALTAVPSETGKGFTVRWEQTQASGVYQFVLTRRTGEQEIRAVAVTLDPSESDLTPAVKAELLESLHPMPVTYIDGLESLGEISEDARRELWKTVLIAVLVVLMGEQFLGWWFGRRT